MTVRCPSGTPFAERFWAKVDKRGPNECWPWTASRRGIGYGGMRVAGRSVGAHRVAWELHNGRPLAAGMFACHTCDNRLCCNPAHLFEGSAKDNTLDACRKERRHNQGKTRCARGHEFVVTMDPAGYPRRRCVVCKKASEASRTARRKESGNGSHQRP